MNDSWNKSFLLAPCHDLSFDIYLLQVKKEEIWLSPMTKAPTPTEKSKMLHDNTKTPSKTSITQRLRTDLGRSVGGNDSHPTGVLKPVNGIPTLPLTTRVV